LQQLIMCGVPLSLSWTVSACETMIVAGFLSAAPACLHGQVALPAPYADPSPITRPLNQDVPCSMILSTKDAVRCLGSVHARGPVPQLDQLHVYTLGELIDIAETASPEGRIAWTVAKQALENMEADRALYLPLISFLAQGGDVRTIVPFPKPIAPRGYVTVEQPLVLAQMQLNYRLLDFGRRATLDGSRALELASTLSLSRVHQAIAFATSSAFYSSQEADGRLEAASTILETAETVLLSSQSEFEHGRATLPDLQNAQAGVAEARFGLATATGEAGKAKLALTLSIGVSPTTAISIGKQENDSPEPLDRTVDDLVQAAWKSRPDLLARAQEVRRAKDASRVVHSGYLPSIGLDAAGGQTATWPTADFGQLGYANDSTWSAQVGLRWELFNGARRHELAASFAEQAAALEEERRTRDAVTGQVWDAYIDYETAVEQQRSAQSFLSAATTSYDSSLDAYKYGVRSLVDVVQAERQLAEARLVAVRSQAQWMRSAVALSYATGE
jgi:outer membrane protein